MSIRVVMTLLVRNEEDVIAENILFHHAQGVSSFLVIDNLSTDATPEILRRLARFVPIIYIKQTADTYDQAKWVTSMARSACLDHGADWVINMVLIGSSIMMPMSSGCSLVEMRHPF